MLFGVKKAPMGVLLCFQQQAVGLHTLVGCTTDREFACTHFLSSCAGVTLPRRLLFGCKYPNYNALRSGTRDIVGWHGLSTISRVLRDLRLRFYDALDRADR